GERVERQARRAFAVRGAPGKERRQRVRQPPLAASTRLLPRAARVPVRATARSVAARRRRAGSRARARRAWRTTCPAPAPTFDRRRARALPCTEWQSES